MNLAINAQDAMLDGGELTIIVEHVGQIPFRIGPGDSAPGGRGILLSVTDTGCGMTDEIRRKIFDPFFTTKVREKGTGLGLATVHGIIHQHTGHIEVASRPGEGSAFRVYLPPANVNIDPVPRPPDAKQSLRGEETIVVAEDDEAVRRTTVRALRNFGYTVIPAKDGEEAAQLLAEHGSSVNLLLTDILMPRLNGIRAAEVATRRNPELKVVCMSGYTDAVLDEAAGGTDGYVLLEKPFTRKELAIAVRSVLDQ